MLNSSFSKLLYKVLHQKSMKHFYCAGSNITFWVLSHENITIYRPNMDFDAQVIPKFSFYIGYLFNTHIYNTSIIHIYIMLLNFVKLSTLLIKKGSDKWYARLLTLAVVWALWSFKIDLLLIWAVLMSSQRAK